MSLENHVGKLICRIREPRKIIIEIDPRGEQGSPWPITIIDFGVILVDIRQPGVIDLLRGETNIEAEVGLAQFAAVGGDVLVKIKLL